MTWFRVDDKLWGHPKWLGLSPRARALWITAGSWSADQLTDGRIPAHVLTTFGAAKRDAEELVRVGLWKPSDDGGWRFHDWTDFQPTAEHVRSERVAAKERQRKARDAARKRRAEQAAQAGNQPSVTDMSQRDTPVTHAVTSPEVTGLSQNPDPTRPDPTRSSYGTTPPAEESAPKRAHQLPANFEPNDTNRRIAAERGLDLAAVVAQFSDHHRAKGSTMKDWHLALNTWLRRERANPSKAAPPSAKISVPEDFETAPTGLTDEQWFDWDTDRRRRADAHREQLRREAS